MRRYLYRQLREYLELYVRPGDRVVEIDAKGAAESLKFQECELLVLESSSREARDPQAIMKQMFKISSKNCVSPSCLRRGL